MGESSGAALCATSTACMYRLAASQGWWLSSVGSDPGSPARLHARIGKRGLLCVLVACTSLAPVAVWEEEESYARAIRR